MKQEVFEGFVDGNKFNDPAKFKEYLEQHTDAKNVSYSHSIRDIADKPAKKELDFNSNKRNYENQYANKPVNNNRQTNNQSLYPPYVDFDKFLSDPDYDLDDVEKLYSDYLKEHKQAIKELDTDELVEHYDHLQDLCQSIKDTIKQNSQAMSKLDDEIKKYSEQIDECKKQIQLRKVQLQTLTAADELIGTGYRTIKEAIVDVNKYRNNRPKARSKSWLEDLLSNIL